MDKELQKYSEIIFKLKPLISSNEFERIFKTITQDIPPDKRFLIKMELKRLAKPCMRSIDLRGLVDAECKLVEYEGRAHYLDTIAEEVFQEQLQLFGLYSFGVYEAVMNTENNFRVMREKSEKLAQKAQSQSEKDASKALLEQYSLPLIPLLDYANRSHERMNFAIPIELQDEFGKSFQVTSVDISQVALRLKISKGMTFTPQQRLFVFFRGLEEEFAMDKHNGIPYSVITTRQENGNLFLILNRENNLSSPAFNKFLDQFIHGNKRRYKVNLESTSEALENKSAEQYVAACSPSLPVFIDDDQGKLIPQYTLVNGINRGVLDYWHDENNQLKLGYLLTASRLKWLKASLDEAKPIYVYTFVYFKAGSIHYYTASTEELTEHALYKSLFMGFGARKVSWRVFRLSMTDISLKQAYVPSSIPASFNDKVKGLDISPSARLLAQMINLRYVVHITDVTSHAGREQVASQVFDKQNLPALKVFASNRKKIQPDLKIYSYRPFEQKLKTNHILRCPARLFVENESESIKALVHDISLYSVRLELSAPYSGSVGDQVRVKYPKLLESAQHSDDAGIIYEVQSIDAERMLLILAPLTGQSGEDANLFAEMIIEHYAHKKSAYQTDEDLPGVTQTFRIVNARNTPNFTFLLSKEGVKLTPSHAILSEVDTWINKLVGHNGGQNSANVEFLYRDTSANTTMLKSSTLGTLKSQVQPMREQVLISYDPSAKKGRGAIISRLLSSFSDSQSIQEFISKAMFRGRFIAVDTFMTPTPKPDMTMMKAELKYVSLYASHKAKAIEEHIWGIGALVHVVDITKEVLFRYDVTLKEDITTEEATE